MCRTRSRGGPALADGGVHVLVGWVRRHPAGAGARSRRRRSRRGPRRPHRRRRASAPDCVAVEEGAPLRVVARGALSGPGVEQEFRSAGRGPWVDDDAPHGTTAVDLRTGRRGCSGPSSPFSRSRPPSTRPRRSCTRPRPRPRRGPTRRSSESAREAAEQAGSPRQPGRRPQRPQWPTRSRISRAAPPVRRDPARAARGRCSAVPRAHDTDSLSEPGIGRAPTRLRAASPRHTPRPRRPFRRRVTRDRATPERAAAAARPTRGPAADTGHTGSSCHTGSPADGWPHRLGPVAQRRLHRAARGVAHPEAAARPHLGWCAEPAARPALRPAPPVPGSGGDPAFDPCPAPSATAAPAPEPAAPPTGAHPAVTPPAATDAEIDEDAERPRSAAPRWPQPSRSRAPRAGRAVPRRPPEPAARRVVPFPAGHPATAALPDTAALAARPPRATWSHSTAGCCWALAEGERRPPGRRPAPPGAGREPGERHLAQPRRGRPRRLARPGARPRLHQRHDRGAAGAGAGAAAAR